MYSLLKGSTRISSRAFSAPSMSFFLTHCMPRLLKTARIVSLLISSVQTPFLQPSLPTRLWGCGLQGKSYYLMYLYYLLFFLLSPIWRILGDTGNDDNSASLVAHNLDGRIGFVFGRRVDAGYGTGRATLAFIAKT